MVDLNDIEFKKRLRVSINKVVYERNLTNKTLAPLLATTPTTVSNYRTMKNMAKTSFITKFCDLFDCNKEWLLTGNGRPFFDSGDAYDDLFEKYWKISRVSARNIPDTSAGRVLKNINSVKSKPSDVQEFSIADDITLAIKVLESKTHYATALHLNIRSFAGAVDDKTTLNAVLARLEDLEAKIIILQTENKGLKEEIKKLKGSSGGCAPIDLSPVNAALTGTEDQKT